MDMDKLSRFGKFLSPRAWDWVFQQAQRIPAVRRAVDGEYAGMLREVAASLRPYRDSVPTFRALPKEGARHEQVLTDMRRMAEDEKPNWHDGKASGAVYQGDDAQARFLAEVYTLNQHTNPLHPDIWPSMSKYEAEIVAMTASVLHGDNEVCGTVSSGGTESILLAMKTYRDRGRHEKGISAPEMVVPTTAHAAFDKAAEYLGIRMVHVPVGKDFRADVQATREAITRDTVVVVGSAPSFPHGVIDPIEELSYLAHERGIGFHTDGCLGAFVLPFAEKLGAKVPVFDFRLPGVTSMSADTHKYGYASKGTSVVLYRSHELRRHQYFVTSEWPGGLYYSPTFAGSRPGGLVAACWAALVTTGEHGYIEATRGILAAAERIKSEIATIPQLRILGDPLWVIAFASDAVDIYQVMQHMHERGWALNGMHKPACVHIAVTPRHASAGVTERFGEDLRWAVNEALAHPERRTGMAPTYGLAASLPVRGAVSDLLKRYVDLLYDP
jgi:sphinganine-1-phosphate aldolase